MTMSGSCDCGNINVTWHIEASSFVPRACQCEYCALKSAAYVTKPGSKVEVVIQSKKLHEILQHGSNAAKFHECLKCDQVVFVTSEIDGELYGALNANHLENSVGFSEPIQANFSSQTAGEKRSRWRQNWCRPVCITIKGP